MLSSPLAAILWSSALPVIDAHFEISSSSSIEDEQEALICRADVEVVEGPMICVVEVPSDRSIHLFTRPGHFAHCSVLTRRLVPTLSGRAVHMNGRTSADTGVMQRWVDQFRTQDERLRSRIQAKRTPPD
jgi:hypothetical protein